MVSKHVTIDQLATRRCRMTKERGKRSDDVNMPCGQGNPKLGPASGPSGCQVAARLTVHIGVDTESRPRAASCKSYSELSICSLH